MSIKSHVFSLHLSMFSVCGADTCQGRECYSPVERLITPTMSSKTRSKPKPQKSHSLSGLVPGIRMKGGTRYDSSLNGFVAIVHTWDNVICTGKIQAWRLSEVFPTEETAMHYYMANIRPTLEQMAAQMAKSVKDVIRRKFKQ